MNRTDVVVRGVVSVEERTGELLKIQLKIHSSEN